MATIGLTFYDVGDRSITFDAKTLNLPATYKIKQVNVLYSNTLMSKPEKYHIVNYPATASGSGINFFDDLLQLGVAPSATGARITLSSLPDVSGGRYYDSANSVPIVPNGYIKNGYETVISVEALGTDASGRSIRIKSSNKIRATPVGAPDSPNPISSEPIDSTSFKIKLAVPSNNGGLPIDKIYAYLSMPDSVGDYYNSKTATAGGRQLDFNTIDFDYPTAIASAVNGYYYLTFDSSSGVVSDAVYNVAFEYSNGYNISALSNSIEGYPSDKPGKPTGMLNDANSNGSIVTFNVPSNVEFAPIKGLVFMDNSGNLATQYYKYTDASGFVSVSSFTDILNNDGGSLVSGVQQQFSVQIPVPNITHQYCQIALINKFITNPNSANFSDDFIVFSRDQPTAVTSLTISKLSIDFSGNNNYDALTVGLVNNNLWDAVPVQVTFNDPNSNWPVPNQAQYLEYYNSYNVECDASATAFSVAVKRYYGVNSSGISRNEPITTVISELTNVVSGITLEAWIALINKSGYVNSKILNLNASSALAATTEYFNVMRFAKYVVTDISINRIYDNGGLNNTLLTGAQYDSANNYTYISGTGKNIFVPAGSVFKITVTPVIYFRTISVGTVTGPSTTASNIISTNKFGVNTISVSNTAYSSNLSTIITGPVFTYGYELNPSNYSVFLTDGNNTYTIPGTNTIFVNISYPNIYIQQKTVDFSANGIHVTNGNSYNSRVTLAYKDLTTGQSGSSTASGTQVTPIGKPEAPVVQNIFVGSDIDTQGGGIVFSGYTANNFSQNAGVRYVKPSNLRFDGTVNQFTRYELVAVPTVDVNNFINTGSATGAVSVTVGPPANNSGNDTNAATLIQNLVNGTSYKLLTRTITSAGGGSNSDWLVYSTPFVPYGVPIAPTGVIMTNYNDKVTISWSPPSDSGLGASTAASDVLYYNIAIYDSTTNAVVSNFNSTQVTGSGNSYPQTVTLYNLNKTEGNIVNGNSYYAKVKAISIKNQTSSASSASSTIVAASSMAFANNNSLQIVNSGTSNFVVGLSPNGRSIASVAIMVVLRDNSTNVITSSTAGGDIGSISTWAVANNSNANPTSLSIDVGAAVNPNVTIGTTGNTSQILAAFLIISDDNGSLILKQS